MPLKPPSKGAVTSDVHTRPTTTPDGHTSPAQTPPRTDFGPATAMPSRSSSAPGGSALTLDADAPSSTPTVAVRQTPSSSSTATKADQRPWADYLSNAPIRLLRPAEAPVLWTLKGRRYAKVPDGVVQVGEDPLTGQLRAKLASQLNPKGPVLVWDPDVDLWHPLEESGSPILRSNRRKSSVETPLSDDEFEMALEFLPDRSQTVDDVFEMASESMPIQPYTAQELTFMRQEVRYTSLSNQRGSYNRANNGKYPLRDSLGRPVRIRTLQSKVTFDSGETYTSEQIKPYIKFEGYETVARLYEEKLQLRQFTEADVRVPGERALIGQSMVVANRRIAKGEVVGVYGGTIRSGRFLLPAEQVFSMTIGMDVVLRSGQLGPGPIAVVGDNIISRLNTHFIYDDTGKPLRQAPDGYNINLIGFKVEADLPNSDGVTRKTYLLNSAFALEDIPAGTELRWNYNYSDEDIGLLFS